MEKDQETNTGQIAPIKQKKKKDIIENSTWSNLQSETIQLTGKLLKNITFNLQVFLSIRDDEKIYNLFCDKLKEDQEEYIPISKEGFFKNLSIFLSDFLTEEMLLNVKEERNSIEMCGFPLCFNKITKSLFCSEFCGMCINKFNFLKSKSQTFSTFNYNKPEILFELLHIFILFDDTECKKISGACIEALKLKEIDKLKCNFILKKLNLN